MPRKIKIVVGAVVLLLFAGGIFYVFNSGPPPAPSLPNPNGYEDFVAAARLARRPLILDTNAPTADLAAEVAGNRRVLDLARAGLAKKCQAFELDESVGTNWMQALAGFKSVCGLLTEEARVAGETNAAAGVGVCIEAVRFFRASVTPAFLHKATGRSEPRRIPASGRPRRSDFLRVLFLKPFGAFRSLSANGCALRPVGVGFFRAR